MRRDLRAWTHVKVPEHQNETVPLSGSLRGRLWLVNTRETHWVDLGGETQNLGKCAEMGEAITPKHLEQSPRMLLSPSLPDILLPVKQQQSWLP